MTRKKPRFRPFIPGLQRAHSDARMADILRRLKQSDLAWAWRCEKQETYEVEILDDVDCKWWVNAYVGEGEGRP